MKKIITTALLATAIVAGSAYAAPLADFAGSSVDVNIAINNGIATLTGHVESALDRFSAGNMAARIDGIEEVRNLITFSR